jgi:pimeloyl-ACP methyl ester carboxylesterase
MSDSPAEPTPEVLETPDGARLAYHRTPGATPGLVFLGGFASDMTGTKATALEVFARERGQAFVRFDYQGHGQSSGRFRDGTIGQWTRDAVAVLDSLTDGPQVLIGSSMGGWIMLLAALARPERVAGLVGIAAAPDFTQDLLWPSLDDAAKRQIQDTGVYDMPSDYGEPLPVTRALFDEGHQHLVMRAPIPLTCPVRLIQGMQDDEVPWDWALKLTERLQANDVETVLVKTGDHRLSEPADLDRLWEQLDRLLAHVG